MGLGFYLQKLSTVEHARRRGRKSECFNQLLLLQYFELKSPNNTRAIDALNGQIRQEFLVRPTGQNLCIVRPPVRPRTTTINMEELSGA